jgi:broad-specificity NMP kinase
LQKLQRRGWREDKAQEAVANTREVLDAVNADIAASVKDRDALTAEVAALEERLARAKAAAAELLK